MKRRGPLSLGGPVPGDSDWTNRVRGYLTGRVRPGEQVPVDPVPSESVSVVFTKRIGLGGMRPGESAPGEFDPANPSQGEFVAIVVVVAIVVAIVLTTIIIIIIITINIIITEDMRLWGDEAPLLYGRLQFF